VLVLVAATIEEQVLVQALARQALPLVGEGMPALEWLLPAPERALEQGAPVEAQG